MTDITRRREAMQRVQFGLAGLLAIVVLIALASIIANNVRASEKAAAEQAVPAANVATAVPVPATEPTEPLADLGAAPAQSDQTVAPDDPPPVTVPDLQPDPKLNKPMDKEPAP